MQLDRTQLRALMVAQLLSGMLPEGRNLLEDAEVHRAIQMTEHILDEVYRQEGHAED